MAVSTNMTILLIFIIYKTVFIEVSVGTSKNEKDEIDQVNRAKAYGFSLSEDENSKMKIEILSSLQFEIMIFLIYSLTLAYMYF